jgi:hypothetical protein
MAPIVVPEGTVLEPNAVYIYSYSHITLSVRPTFRSINRIAFVFVSGLNRVVVLVEDTVGRPSWKSSLLGDPGAKFLCGKPQHMKNSLNFANTCFKVVDTRRWSRTEAREWDCAYERDEVLLRRGNLSSDYCYQPHFRISAETGHVTEQDVLNDYLRRPGRPTKIVSQKVAEFS